jgi:hypothetical protein
MQRRAPGACSTNSSAASQAPNRPPQQASLIMKERLALDFHEERIARIANVEIQG